MAMQDNIIFYKNGNKRVIPLSTLKDHKLIYTFNEFETIELENQTSITISCEQAKDDELMIIHPNERVYLSDYVHSYKSHTFFPGEYLIKINTAIPITCFFKVNSNALGDGIKNIRKIVENFCEGLALDVNKTKSYVRSGDPYDKMYTLINSNQKKIIHELEYILHNPQESLQKTITLTAKPVKESRLNIRFANTHNPIKSKNIDVSIKKTYNCIENVLLKATLHRIIKHYDKMIELYENLILDANKRNYDISLCNEHLLNIRIMKNHLSRFMNQSYLKDIPSDYTIYDNHLMNKNVHYKKIADSYIEMTSTTVNDERSLVYEYKKTSDLYEIYVLILVFKILFSKGYKLESDINELRYLQEGDSFIFNHNFKKKMVRIIFNGYIKSTDEYPRDELIRQNSRSNKPDIVVMTYDHKKLQDVCILEVKCRHLSNFYIKGEETKVLSQLKDYTNFWYFDHSYNLSKGPVSCVYAIYPDKVANIEYINAKQICLLALQPELNYEKSQSYKNLVSLISKHL